jgi:hypothetical protein
MGGVSLLRRCCASVSRRGPPASGGAAIPPHSHGHGFTQRRLPIPRCCAVVEAAAWAPTLVLQRSKQVLPGGQRSAPALGLGSARCPLHSTGFMLTGERRSGQAAECAFLAVRLCGAVRSDDARRCAAPHSRPGRSATGSADPPHLIQPLRRLRQRGALSAQGAAGGSGRDLTTALFTIV